MLGLIDFGPFNVGVYLIIPWGLIFVHMCALEGYIRPFSSDCFVLPTFSFSPSYLFFKLRPLFLLVPPTFTINIITSTISAKYISNYLHVYPCGCLLYYWLWCTVFFNRKPSIGVIMKSPDYYDMWHNDTVTHLSEKRFVLAFQWVYDVRITLSYIVTDTTYYCIGNPVATSCHELLGNLRGTLLSPLLPTLLSVTELQQVATSCL